MRIAPARRLRGTIRLPGDKSISHRAALIAALARGPSLLANFSTSQDCAATLDCLIRLGVPIKRIGNDVHLEGVGIGGLAAPIDALDCGNSGSTMRMLAGVLAGHSFTSTLTGDESLRARPMRRIIEPLELMGAALKSDGGRPPLRVTGHQPLRPIRYELPVASAQLKTCLLLAGLHADGRTEVVEKLGETRDHTERLLRWFGVELETTETRSDDIATNVCAVEGPAQFASRDVQVPGDFSSAAFLIAAAALLPGSELAIEGLGLNPSRTCFLELLRNVGTNIEITETREVCNELTGTLRLRGMGSGADVPDRTASWERRHAGSPLGPPEWGAVLPCNEREARTLATPTCGTPVPHSQMTIDGRLSAALIDELPLVAVIGTQVPGGLSIRGARELRFKETDRIAATVANLRAMGVEAQEYEDGLTINGPARLRGAKLDSYGDHRIAMAFTVAALLAEGNSELPDSECVSVSFPEFFECLESVVER